VLFQRESAIGIASVTLKAMQTADPTNPALKKVPYIGVQFVGIPEFQSIGQQVGPKHCCCLDRQDDGRSGAPSEPD